MEIRIVKKEEYSKVKSLIEDVFQHHMFGFNSAKQEAFLNLFNLKYQTLHYLGAFTDQLVGVIGFDDYSHIVYQFVQVSQQRKGIGTKLLIAFSEMLKEKGLARLTVNALGDSVSFYQHFGFDAEKGQDSFFTPMEYLLQNHYLNKIVTVEVDHPLGSFHAHYPDLQYPCNTGYILEDFSQDKDFIEAYVVDCDEPIETYQGKVIGVIYHKNQQVPKLVVSNHDSYNKQEVINVIGPLEESFESRIVWNK